MALPGAAVLQALGHVVDGAGQRGELGVVAAPDRDPAGQLARRDAARRLHGLDQRPGHAARICHATRAATSSAAPPATMK